MLKANTIKVEEEPADARDKLEVQKSVENLGSPEPKFVNSDKMHKNCHNRQIALYKKRILHKPTLKGFRNKNVLKKLRINISLVEALKKMPNYVKFMKDILSKKKRLREFETVALTKECSAFL
ncbi:retrotransposon gag protein [Gossypium australe]|uniref:Retrotransposon gag protein n=1 Tax=Gossypium australe TaxID=47621 RepID=A0A5B6WHJ8_9ROSI|nr:retrotransposon gag protein [Gossypium australe]